MSTSDSELGALDELYQEIILDHSRRPHHYGAPDGANRRAEGYNPLCGDRYTVYVRIEGDRIGAIGFEGAGCAISKASASMMTDAVLGRRIAEARELFDRFRAMLTEERGAGAGSVGKLAVLEGVRKFPVRVKCATLAWHTLDAAIQGRGETVSTE